MGVARKEASRMRTIRKRRNGFMRKILGVLKG